jgi:hypothetical protein
MALDVANVFPPVTPVSALHTLPVAGSVNAAPPAFSRMGEKPPPGDRVIWAEALFVVSAMLVAVSVTV